MIALILSMKWLLMSWLADGQAGKVLCLFVASIFLLIAAGGR